MHLRRAKAAVALWLLAVLAPLHAEPLVAVIIDDLGYELDAARRAAALPAAVTLSLLPDAPYSQEVYRLLASSRHELMLHLPMQAMHRDAPREPVQFTEYLGRTATIVRLARLLARYPAVRGVNNHQGSLLTQREPPMQWLMRGLRDFGGLYFVDSRTHRATVAERVAAEFGVPHTRRDVFLDATPHDRGAFRRALAELLRLARRNGTAVAIAHPHRESLQELARALPRLQAAGIRLAPVSAVIQRQEETTCPECSSPLLRVVKNSKPSPSSTCCGGPVLR